MTTMICLLVAALMSFSLLTAAKNNTRTAAVEYAFDKTPSRPVRPDTDKRS